MPLRLWHGAACQCTAAGKVSRHDVDLHCPMQEEDSPEQSQKTDEELAQERMSQWVKSDDAAPAAEGDAAAAGEAEEAQADQTEAEEEIEVDEEEAAEEVPC